MARINYIYAVFVELTIRGARQPETRNTYLGAYHLFLPYTGLETNYAPFNTHSKEYNKQRLHRYKH